MIVLLFCIRMYIILKFKEIAIIFFLFVWEFFYDALYFLFEAIISFPFILLLRYLFLPLQQTKSTAHSLSAIQS